MSSTPPDWATPLPDGGVGVRYQDKVATRSWAGAIVLGLASAFTVFDGWSRPASSPLSTALVAGLLALLAVVLRWFARKARRGLAFRIDEQGLHRGGIGPALTIRWSDIERIRPFGRDSIAIRTHAGWTTSSGRSRERTFVLRFPLLEGGSEMAQYLIDRWEAGRPSSAAD